MRVCEYMCECECVCVCVTEREREKVGNESNLVTENFLLLKKLIRRLYTVVDVMTDLAVWYVN